MRDEQRRKWGSKEEEGEQDTGEERRGAGMGEDRCEVKRGKESGGGEDKNGRECGENRKRRGKSEKRGLS